MADGKKYKYAIDEQVWIEGANGVRKRVHITANSLAEASKKIDAWTQKLGGGNAPAGPTVREFSEEWLKKYVDPRELAPKSGSMYPDMLRIYILPVIGDIPLAKLTAGDCQAVLANMGRKAKSYQHKCQVVLQALIRSAVQNELIPRDVTAGIQLSPTAAPPKPRRAITESERRALEAVCYRDVLRDGKPNDSGAFYLLMLYCGLRPGECCALKKADIDFESKFITISAAKERGSNRIKEPKTAAGFRRVPMTDDFSTWLQSWMQRHATRPECEYVFAQRDRVTPLTDSSMQRKWQTYKRYIDLELGATWEMQKTTGRKRKLVITNSVVAQDLVPYDLRHTYATNLILYGLDAFMVTYLMGHSDPSVTQKYYLHIGQAQLDLAAQRMAAYRATHTEVQMSDIANWGMGLGLVDEAQEQVEGAYYTLVALAETDPDGECELTQAALDNLQIAMLNSGMQMRIRYSAKNAAAALGTAYSEADFVTVYNEIFVYGTWPGENYRPSRLHEKYLLAMTGNPHDKLAGMAAGDREAYIRGLIEWAKG